MVSYVDVVLINETFHVENQTGLYDKRDVENQTGLYDEVEASRVNPEAIVVPTVFLIIFVFGVTGNGTLLYLIGRCRELKKVPYMLILNLAVADLLMNVVCVPFTATIYSFESWQFGTAMCKLNEYLQTVVVSVSIFTLCALSIERFAMVSGRWRGGGTRADAARNRRAVLVTIGASWLLAFVFGLPDLISADVLIYDHADPPIAVCFPHPTPGNTGYSKVIIIVKFFYLFLLPIMVVITVFYSLMALILCSNAEADPMPSTYTTETAEKSLVDRVAKKGHVQKRRLHLAKLVLCLVAIFVACWLPRHVYLIWWHFSLENYSASWHYFKIVAFCLTFLMSALNPLVVYWLDDVVRRYAKRHLFCCCYAETEELQPLGEEDMELSILP